MFITLEGVEGCGKSTQARLLRQKLEDISVPVLLTQEPGATGLGQRITRLLQWSDDVPISPVAELLLFNADRAQHVEEVIGPALDEGKVVICDRYADSTTAYQGYARGIDLETVDWANEIGTRGIVPDLTILLDVPVEEGVKRKKGDTPDRFEAESVEFHNNVRLAFLAIAEAEPQRWLIIDGTQDKQTIAGIIWQSVSRRMDDRG